MASEYAIVTNTNGMDDCMASSTLEDPTTTTLVSVGQWIKENSAVFPNKGTQQWSCANSLSQNNAREDHLEHSPKKKNNNNNNITLNMNLLRSLFHDKGVELVSNCISDGALKC